jgi:hypothetical protein
MIEVLKQALDALEVEDLACRYEKEQTPEHIAKAITSLRQAIAEFDSHTLYREGYVNGYAFGEAAGKRQAIAKLESQEPDYWLGYGLQAHTEKPFENATALYIHPPQRTEQNFCSRCGKRTNDIHTCTPPQEKNT